MAFKEFDNYGDFFVKESIDVEEFNGCLRGSMTVLKNLYTEHNKRYLLMLNKFITYILNKELEANKDISNINYATIKYVPLESIYSHFCTGYLEITIRDKQTNSKKERITLHVNETFNNCGSAFLFDLNFMNDKIDLIKYKSIFNTAHVMLSLFGYSNVLYTCNIKDQQNLNKYLEENYTLLQTFTNHRMGSTIHIYSKELDYDLFSENH